MLTQLSLAGNCSNIITNDLTFAYRKSNQYHYNQITQQKISTWTKGKKQKKSGNIKQPLRRCQFSSLSIPGLLILVSTINLIAIMAITVPFPTLKTLYISNHTGSKQ